MADVRERINDPEESIRMGAGRELSRFWTALPVKVVEDSDGHIVKVQPTIKGSIQNDDGAVQSTEMPVMGMVPIHYPAGGGFTVTHPIKKDDEGIAIFSSRCIDGWWKDGGLQAEPYHRQNNLSDGMFIPGIRNKPRKLNPYVSKDSVQLRTDNQHFYVEIRDDMVRLVYAVDKNEEGQTLATDGGNGSTGGGNQDQQEKEKKTQPQMVLMVVEDKIKGVTFDEQGQEKNWFELTKDGEFRIKAPKQVFIDTPVLKVTGKIIAGGEITAKTGVSVSSLTGEPEIDEFGAGGDSVSMSTHKHPQGNDSRGDREQDTGVPIAGS